MNSPLTFNKTVVWKHGVAEATLAAVVRKVSTKEVPFEQSLEGREDTSQMNGLRKGIPGWGKSTCKGPEAETSLAL